MNLIMMDTRGGVTVADAGRTDNLDRKL